MTETYDVYTVPDEHEDPYASAGDDERVRTFTVGGKDWDTVADAAVQDEEGHLVVNMGPQHPSTHGVLRLMLALDGETVTECRVAIGYLHTGIEKNCEYRTFTQGVTFVTRADYLMPIHNETAYVLSVERLLGIENDIPERANIIRVLTMELTRLGSHIVAIATAGMEIGALTVMTFGFRERELILDMLEMITGLRMNHGYIRPGGVIQDLPDDGLDRLRDFVTTMWKRIPDYEKLLNENPIFIGRLKGIASLDLPGCMSLGITGPPLRATGIPWDLRKTQPYCGYEDYEFDVMTGTGADAYDRYLIRVEEMKESLRIISQCIDRLGAPKSAPVMIDDPKIGWPAKLAVGADGQGNSLDHIRHIMGTSMEALIHHFKLVTEGYRVPAGQAYVPIESPKGELGCHLVSDGGTRPYRVHLRDPSFVNLQAVPAMAEGGMIADVIVAVASVDPVIGGVDR